MGQEIADRYNPSRQMKVNEDGSIDTKVQNDDSNPIPVMDFGQLVPKVYDYIVLTYVAAGNGAGKIETVTYKTGGASGTVVAVLTLSYDANDKISTITRS